MTEDRYWEQWHNPEKRQEVKDFWDKNPQQPIRRQQFNDILRDVVERAKATTVLDFGCGTGEDYQFMTQELGLAYKGVDVTPEMLEDARRQFPGIDVSLDDIFNSKQGDQEHPFVVNSAVLPHLPREMIQNAINELWRITGKVLVIRLFGVDHRPEEMSFVNPKGFVLNWLHEATWMEMLLAVNPAKHVIHRDKDNKDTRDIMVVELWRE